MPAAIFNRPIRPLSCDVCPSKFWTTQGLSKHRSTMRHYNTPATLANSSPGTNQQCFMCMRKVVNLFIHIENVHGMTMKDLIAMRKCIICGNTSVDRKSLESHMASVHGVLIKATDFVAQDKPNKPLVPIQQNSPKPAVNRSTGIPVGKNAKPSIKQNLCVFCQLMFADNIQLTMHCIKNHATCTGCGMVVQSNKHLSNHNCKQMKRHCDICGMKNISPGKYIEHIKTLHMKPCKVTITKMSDDDIDEIKDKIKREYKPAVISLDSEEDSDVELVDADEADKKIPAAADGENKENIEKPKEERVELKGNDKSDVKSDIKEENINEENIDIKNESDDSEIKQEQSDTKDENKDSESDSSSRKRKISDCVQSEPDEEEVSSKKVKTDNDAPETGNNVKDDSDQAADDLDQASDDPDQAAGDPDQVPKEETSDVADEDIQESNADEKAV